MALTVDDGRKDRLVFDPEAIHIFHRRHLHLRFALHGRCSTAMLRTFTPEQAAGDWTDVRQFALPCAIPRAQFGAQLDKLAHGVSISRLIGA
jgi:hypothetical protein